MIHAIDWSDASDASIMRLMATKSAAYNNSQA